LGGPEFDPAWLFDPGTEEDGVVEIKIFGSDELGPSEVRFEESEAPPGTLGGEGKQIHGMHPGFTLA
jgi:hypothetical protein